MEGHTFKICYKNNVRTLKLPTLSISRSRFVKECLELFELTPELNGGDGNNYNDDSITDENFWEFFALYDNNLNELNGDDFTLFLIFYTMLKVCYLKRVDDDTELTPYVDTTLATRRETNRNISYKRQLRSRLITNCYDDDQEPAPKIFRSNAFLIRMPPLYD